MTQALPDLLKNHRKQVLWGLHKGFFKWEEVNPTPQEWRDSIFFSILALRRGLAHSCGEVPKLTNEMYIEALKGEFQVLNWQHIPLELKNDERFCRVLLDPQAPVGPALKNALGHLVYPFDRHWSDSMPMISLSQRIFAIHASHRQDPLVWEKFINGFDSNRLAMLVGALYWEHDGEVDQHTLPPTDALITQAVRKSHSLIKKINQAHFSEVVRSIIEEDSNALVFVFEPFIIQNEDFCKTHLAKMDVKRLSMSAIQEFAEDIPGNWWNDADFEQTWFIAGLPLVESQPAAWRSDADKILRVVEHSAKLQWKKSAIQRDPDELKGNVEFITRAMEFHTGQFAHAAEGLRTTNYELAIWALADPEFLPLCIDGLRYGQYGTILTAEKLYEYYERARKDMIDRVAFETFLHQQQLDRPLLRQIRDFVGIPRGNLVRHIIQALSNRVNFEAEQSNEQGHE